MALQSGLVHAAVGNYLWGEYNDWNLEAMALQAFVAYASAGVGSVVGAAAAIPLGKDFILIAGLAGAAASSATSTALYDLMGYEVNYGQSLLSGMIGAAVGLGVGFGLENTHFVTQMIGQHVAAGISAELTGGDFSTGIISSLSMSWTITISMQMQQAIEKYNYDNPELYAEYISNEQAKNSVIIADYSTMGDEFTFDITGGITGSNFKGPGVTGTFYRVVNRDGSTKTYAVNGTGFGFENGRSAQVGIHIGPHEGVSIAKTFSFGWIKVSYYANPGAVTTNWGVTLGLGQFGWGGKHISELYPFNRSKRLIFEENLGAMSIKTKLTLVVISSFLGLLLFFYLGVVSSKLFFIPCAIVFIAQGVYSFVLKCPRCNHPVTMKFEDGDPKFKYFSWAPDFCIKCSYPFIDVTDEECPEKSSPLSTYMIDQFKNKNWSTQETSSNFSPSLRLRFWKKIEILFINTLPILIGLVNPPIVEYLNELSPYIILLYLFYLGILWLVISVIIYYTECPFCNKRVFSASFSWFDSFIEMMASKKCIDCNRKNSEVKDQIMS